MATVQLTNATISIGDVDLSQYASDVGFDLSPWQEQALSTIGGVPGTLNLSGFWMTSRGHATAAQYEAVMALVDYWAAVKRRRLRRMHTAYSRRRGRGQR